MTSGEGSTLIFESGTISATHGPNTANIVFHVQTKSKVIINGGTFIRENCPDAGDLIYALTGGTIEINGGFFRNDGYPRYLLNTSSSGTQMIVRGGTFVDHHPGKSNDAHAIHVPEGYQVVSEKQANGETFYTVVPVS